MYGNYHTHTTRCGHAQGDPKEYVERAIRRGFKELGFSEHVPYPFPDGYESGYRLKFAELDQYCEDVLNLRREYRNDIRIFLGFEAEYYPEYFKKLLKVLDSKPYDYLIMGQHFLKNEIDYGVNSFRTTDDPDLLRLYVSQVIEGLRTDRFTYLAHPDLVNLVDHDDVYEEEYTRLCIAANETGTPLEINMYGKRTNRTYPSDRFFRIAGENGCTAIIGCDAHMPDYIDDVATYDECAEMAEKHGLKLIDRVALKNPHLS